METIELRVARALSKAHLMEAVLHGTGEWQVSLGTWGVSTGDLVVPGHRVVAFQEVSIEADFPAHCWLGARPTLMMLLYEGEIRAVKPILHPGDGAFSLTWSFSIQVVEQAA